MYCIKILRISIYMSFESFSDLKKTSKLEDIQAGCFYFYLFQCGFCWLEITFLMPVL